MVLQILLRQIYLGFFLLVAARRFVLAIFVPCYVLDNGDSYSRFAKDIDQAVRLLLTGILVLVLLPMLIDTGCDLVFVSFRPPLENYKMVSWRKKEFEDLEDLLVSFKLYFVIAEDSLCIFTMYYLLL